LHHSYIIYDDMSYFWLWWIRWKIKPSSLHCMRSIWFCSLKLIAVLRVGISVQSALLCLLRGSGGRSPGLWFQMYQQNFPGGNGPHDVVEWEVWDHRHWRGFWLRPSLPQKMQVPVSPISIPLYRLFRGPTHRRKETRKWVRLGLLTSINTCTPNLLIHPFAALSYISLLQDDENNDWTLFGHCWDAKTSKHPTRKERATSWNVFSRKPTLSAEDFANIKGKLEAVGFSTSDADLIQPNYTS